MSQSQSHRHTVAGSCHKHDHVDMRRHPLGRRDEQPRRGHGEHHGQDSQDNEQPPQQT